MDGRNEVDRAGQVVLRPAGPADAAVLATLNHHVHDMHVEAEPERYSATDDAVVASRFEAFLADAHTDIVVADVDGAPAGYVVVVGVVQPAHAFAPERRFALVDQIAVAPTARRRGVGRLLMEFAADRASARGFEELQLDVRSHNADARAFYEELGYAPVQTRLAKKI